MEKFNYGFQIRSGIHFDIKKIEYKRLKSGFMWKKGGYLYFLHIKKRELNLRKKLDNRDIYLIGFSKVIRDK